MTKINLKKLNKRSLSSLKYRAPIQTLFTCLLIGTLLCLVSFSQTQKLIEKKSNSEKDSIMNQLVTLIQKPLLNNDNLGLQFTLQEMTTNKFVKSCSFFDVNGDLVVKSSTETSLNLNSEKIEKMLEFEKTVLGTLVVELDLSQIQSEQMMIFYYVVLMWLLLTVVLTLITFRNSANISKGIADLTSLIPGDHPTIKNEIDALKSKLQPLIKNLDEIDILQNSNSFACIFSGVILNRQSLNNELGKENQNSLFEKVDLCVKRTLELYGGERLEGNEGTISFLIRSNSKSKQHILISLMAVHTLNQVLIKLSRKMSVNLNISWSIHNDELPLAPLFKFHESIQKLKVLAREEASKNNNNDIVLSSIYFDFDELTTIARFKFWRENIYLLEGFDEQRQVILQKQIDHICSVCF